jgi:hypothetical protein
MPECSVEGYHIPISVTDLEAIQGIIREHEIFCAPVPDFDLYNSLTWRRQAAHHGTQIYALFDRNVLSDVLHLVRPAGSQISQDCGERERIGAALMAFLQCSNIIIEPNIALYENPSLAREELRLFRRADDVDAGIYTDIALRRRHSIPTTGLPERVTPIPDVDFHIAIKGRRNLTVATLKIAEVELSELPPVQKMERFLYWSFSEFLFLAGPLQVAVVHFSPHRECTVLKNLRSPDRQRALRALRNAVWDLQVIYQWIACVRRQREENRFWLLCSRDRALQHIARSVFCCDEGLCAAESNLQKLFEINWGRKDGSRLAELAITLIGKADDIRRTANQNTSNAYPDELLAQLEQDILAWRPRDLATE